MKVSEEGIYPCTIEPTRYTGAYEGGTWAAFELAPEHLDALEWNSDDVSARNWWDKNRGRVGGIAGPIRRCACYDLLRAFGRDGHGGRAGGDAARTIGAGETHERSDVVPTRRVGRRSHGRADGRRLKVIASDLQG